MNLESVGISSIGGINNKLERGSIIISSIGGINGKPRPFAVIQTNLLTDNLFTVIVAPLTGEVNLQSEDFRPIIRPSITNHLDQVSQIMLDRITTIHKKDIHQVLGTVSKKELTGLNSCVSFVLGL